MFVKLLERGLKCLRQARRFFDEFLSFSLCPGLRGFAAGFGQLVADVVVQIAQHRQVNLLCVIARREKRNLHQPGFDGFDEAEVRHNPLEKRVGIIARSR